MHITRIVLKRNDLMLNCSNCNSNHAKCNNTLAIRLFSVLFSFFLVIRASTHTREAAYALGRYCAIGFFNHMIIPSCDWLVIHVKIMVIIFIYYFLQPFAVVGCVRCVTICRVGLYADFIKSPFLGCFS